MHFEIVNVVTSDFHLQPLSGSDELFACDSSGRLGNALEGVAGCVRGSGEYNLSRGLVGFTVFSLNLEHVAAMPRRRQHAEEDARWE